MDLTIKTLSGLEEVLAAELDRLGAEDIYIGRRVVVCRGDQRLMYRICYECRTALRVLQPIASFKTKHENHFYKKAQEIDWPAQFDLDDTFAVDAVTQSKYLNHSRYLALKTKDAIVDQFRVRYDGRRPSIDVRRPKLRLNVHIAPDNVCTISRDASGSSLHRRGYRTESVEAPLNEALAAGMLLLAGYDGSQPLYDPMCGSGTLPIEAAMIARNIPVQQHRADPFGFETWKDFDAELWEEVRLAAKHQTETQPQPIFGSDRDFAAYRAAQYNAEAAGVADSVKFFRQKFEKASPPTEEPGLLVMNPPYDERLKSEEIMADYKQYGDVLKQNFSGWTAWILSGNFAALKRIGLGASKKIPLLNGKIECKFQKYELYRGSRRDEN